MASVIDLYTELAEMRGLDFGELRHLARALQSAELLPRAARRQRMHPPQITSKDCATFLIGLAASRTSGARIPSELKRRVRRFKKLVCDLSDGTESNLFSALVQLIDNLRDERRQSRHARSWLPMWLVFINDDQQPEVWLDFGHLRAPNQKTDVEQHHRRLTYISRQMRERIMAGLEPDPNRDAFCADAFFMFIDIVFRVGEILGPLEHKDAAQ